MKLNEKYIIYYDEIKFILKQYILQSKTEDKLGYIANILK